MFKKKQLAVTAATFVMALTASGPAFGLNYTQNDEGGSARVSGRTVTLKDISDDGKFHTVHFRYGPGNQRALTNKLGYGRSVSATELRNISNTRMCRSQTLAPMKCGKWYFGDGVW